MPKIKLSYIGIALFIAVAAISYYYLYPSQTAGLNEGTSKSFTSSQFGISFLYPLQYKLDQENVGPAAPIHYRIALRKSAVAVPGSGGEATPAISIDIYENDHQYDSAEDFIHENPDSDANLVTSPIDTVTVAGEPALSYRSTGLYESRTVVIAKTGYVYMFRVSGGQEEPGLDRDFERILATLKVTEIEKASGF